MYPPIQPYETGKLHVSKLHTLYYELSGNKDGTPVLFVHGGPGAGCSELDRSFFNPEKYKIILFDQRGSGKSTPIASIEENTTWDLIKDIELLRNRLGVEKWHVFGGSWGSLLSLAYAQSHPDRVKSLILRGMFTSRQSELDFTYRIGVNMLFPEAWDEFIAPIPEEERHDLLYAYHIRLTSPDSEIRIPAAKVWSKFEVVTSAIQVDPKKVAEADNEDWANAVARIESHYFTNGSFLRDGQLFEKQEIDKIRHIPTVVVQGRYDMLCPVSTAYDLKKAFPEIDLKIVPDAGHSSREPGTAKLLVEATDKFSNF